jgi:hypothetical protein
VHAKITALAAVTDSSWAMRKLKRAGSSGEKDVDIRVATHPSYWIRPSVLLIKMLVPIPHLPHRTHVAWKDRKEFQPLVEHSEWRRDHTRRANHHGIVCDCVPKQDETERTRTIMSETGIICALWISESLKCAEKTSLLHERSPASSVARKIA